MTERDPLTLVNQALATLETSSTPNDVRDAVGILRSNSKIFKYFPQLAEKKTRVLAQANARIGKIEAQNIPSSLSRLANFFWRVKGVPAPLDPFLDRIDLPEEFVHCEGEGELEIPVSEELSLLLADSPSELSFSEKEAFKMKCLSLLGKGSNLSFHDIKCSLKKTPIHTHMIDSKQFKLQQRICPLPGEFHVVKGQFIRTGGFGCSIPIAKSFEKILLAKQTGIPFSSQEVGWAVPGTWILYHPHRPDKIPLFDFRIRRRDSIAKELLPGGSLNSKAKQILNLRHEVFDGHAEYFVKQMSELMKALIDSSEGSDVVDRFMATVLNHSSPYHFLSGTHDFVNDLFFTKPYRALQEAWIQGLNPSLHVSDSKQIVAAIYDYIRSIRASIMAEVAAVCREKETQGAFFDYIQHLGNALCLSGDPIVLQSLSENMGFAPPMLNDRERKFQLIALHQMDAFARELLSDSDEVDLLGKIETIKEILLADDFDAIEHGEVECVAELEEYFNMRYFGKKRK